MWRRPLYGRCVGSGRSQPDPILTDRAALGALIDAGLTFDEIAARAGCSVATLRRAARRLGLPPSKPGRKPTPVLADREALAALIASGLSTAQIAEQVGRSTNVVRAWVKRHDLTLPQHSWRPPDPPLLRDVEWLRREHHDRGRSITDIAREVGRPRTMVGRRFREYGIPIRQQRTYQQLRDAGWLDAQYAAGNPSHLATAPI
jgi:DNA-binding CsgD family transcriptional regulator